MYMVNNNVSKHYSFVKSNSCWNVFHNNHQYEHNAMLGKCKCKCKSGNSFIRSNYISKSICCCYGKKYTSHICMNSNNSKLKKKMLNISDSILNEKKTHIYYHNYNNNNHHHISSMECKARDIIKNSPSQKKVIKCGLLKKYNANKVNQIFHPHNGKFTFIRKQTQIDHTKYMNELKKAFLINK